VRILSVAGARPNFVKIAPLIREMRRYPALVPLLVHTGQHYDQVMSEHFFTDLEIPAPDFHLSVGSGSHAVQNAVVMRRLAQDLFLTSPAILVVV